MTDRVAAAAVAALLAACAETTIDTSRSTVASGPTVATTVFVRAGTPTELLPELSTELSRLSALVIANEGDEAALARIDALWAAAHDQVAAERADLLPDLDAAIALARTGVERRRPADADKAFRNLTALVDEYVGDG